MGGPDHGPAGRGPAAPLACERCRRRAAAVCATDEPENEGALRFGDPLLGRLLCRPCLRQTERDGPWSAVDLLDPVA